ncbi:MAG: TonB-dependent receptor plug domain-containing protein [Myxococcota bacterium]
MEIRSSNLLLAFLVALVVAPAIGHAQSGGESSPPEDALPEDALPEDAQSEDAQSEDAQPEDAPSEDARSEDAASEEALPEGAESERAQSEQAPSEQAPSEQAPSEQAPSEQARPEELNFGATAEVKQPTARTNRLDATASGTEVSLRGRPPLTDPAAVLREVPGARPLVTGGLGAFQSVSLRGAELQHTTTMLGNIRLGSPDTGAFDLSRIPLGALDRLTVYRGGAPAWLGEGAVGGVVHLSPTSDRDSAMGASAATGSFGTYSGDLYASVWSPGAQTFVLAGATHSDNRFPFDDDGGTAFDGSDDRRRDRRNAEFTSSRLLGHANLALGPGNLQVLLLGVGSIQGEPGPASDPSLVANRRRTDGLVGLSYEIVRDGPLPYRIQASASLHHQRDRFDDRLGEIGNGGPRSSDDEVWAADGRLAGTVSATDWLDLTGVGTVRFDRYVPEIRGQGVSATSERLSVGVTGEARLHGDLGPVRVELRPSARVLFSEADFASAETDVVAPTFRVAAAASPASFVTFSASIASGQRLPSIIEVFGDRGRLQANLDLVPERSISVDGGVVLRGRTEALRGQLEVRGFHLAIDDLIRYRPTSQFTAVAENIAQGTATGLEVGGAGWLGRHVEVGGSLTLLSTDNGAGQSLPLRPGLLAYVGPWLHSGELGSAISDLAAGATLTHTGKNFADPANLVELPERTFFGAVIRVVLFDRRLTIDATIEDLADRGGSDLLGFPIPGRRFRVALSYEELL